jgi:hypothetical protein
MCQCVRITGSLSSILFAVRKERQSLFLCLSVPPTHLLHKPLCQARKLTCPVAQDGHSELVQGLNLGQSQNDVPCPNPIHVTNHSLFQLVEWPLLDLSEMYDYRSIHCCNIMANLRHNTLLRLDNANSSNTQFHSITINLLLLEHSHF